MLDRAQCLYHVSKHSCATNGQAQVRCFLLAEAVKAAPDNQKKPPGASALVAHERHATYPSYAPPSHQSY